LVQTVVDLLDTPNRWPALREAGRRFVEEERNWTNSVSRYITPYNTLKPDC
jgi:glycosyltransferase involved in cell wall biosynthesis